MLFLLILYCVTNQNLTVYRAILIFDDNVQLVKKFLINSFHTEQLDKAISYAADQGCKIFYTGPMGDFDNLFSSAVRKAKKLYPDIKLICVKPYMTKDINECGEYLYSLYDDIIIPTKLADVHYKAAITKRNQWIIQKSEIVILYSTRNYGGAYKTMKYAKQNNKTIIEFDRRVYS